MLVLTFGHQVELEKLMVDCGMIKGRVRLLELLH